MGTKRMRTALIEPLRSPIKDKILVLPSNMGENRDKNEDKDRLRTPRYFKAKLNAQFAHRHCFIRLVGKPFNVIALILDLPLIYPQLR